MNKKELIEKVVQKKEFSELPKRDVEKALGHFDNVKYLDEEKVKLTRDLLRKVFSVFTSQKILRLKERDFEWVLKKHLSTRERFPYYKKLYEKILRNELGNITIFDLGSGVNGFSYPFFPKKVNYVGVEAMGQLVDLMNLYFSKKEIKKAMAVQQSLFELEKIKKLLEEGKGKKIVFLFKTLDSLEMLEKDFSKKLLKKIVPLVDKVVVSFATRSLGNGQRFRANRRWFTDFVGSNFKILSDFEFGNERYIEFYKAK
tara:strand:- start:1243 stop:2013 length:771 start_codon:yes stop_codon:yes gene_type:complete